MRKYYYWALAGTVGFLLGQGAIVMWPEWSAWTWWGLATAVAIVGFPLPTLWDKWKARQPRKPGAIRKALGWFRKQRTLTHYTVWEQDRGRGDLAAKLIEAAPNFGEAEETFNHCRYDRQPRNLTKAIDAMADRLVREGRTDETMQFLQGEVHRLIYQLAVDMPPQEGAYDHQYLWAATAFRNEGREQ